MAITMNVYGRLRATLTIHIETCSELAAEEINRRLDAGASRLNDADMRSREGDLPISESGLNVRGRVPTPT